MTSSQLREFLILFHAMIADKNMKDVEQRLITISPVFKLFAEKHNTGAEFVN